ncbi:hypothetical protein CN211_30100 [Sinorhizobium meliloti]|nr:hypothetical protein CN211_30100 [Sinorhizobium meliloti]
MDRIGLTTELASQVRKANNPCAPVRVLHRAPPWHSLQRRRRRGAACHRSRTDGRSSSTSGLIFAEGSGTRQRLLTRVQPRQGGIEVANVVDAVIRPATGNRGGDGMPQGR